MTGSNYWSRWQQRRLGRRGFLATAGASSAGLAGLALVGCGDDDDDDDGGNGGGGGGQVTQAANTPNQASIATPTPSGEEAVRGGTLRTGTFLSVLGIDPHIEVSVGLGTIQKVYTYLGYFDNNNQTFNPLASEKVENPSATEFIFTLRKDVKWQNLPPVNGRGLNAEDVLYSLERFRDLPQAQNNDFFKTIVDKMEVVDDYTFRITTKIPYAEALSEIGGVQKGIVAREDVEAKTDLSNGGIGAGPYIIEEYVKGERTVLKRNPDYFNKDLPYLDKWQQVTILDTNTLIQAYKNDQIDINGAILTKFDFDELKRNDNLVSISLPSFSYGSFGMNASVEPFTNPMVRQAIYVGTNRGQFADKVYQGEASPMGPLNPALSFWAISEEELKPYIGPDVKKAKELLSAAGYADGLDIEILTSGALQVYIDHANVMVAELKNIGINAELKLNDLPTYLSEGLFKGNFQSTVFTHNPYETPKIPIGFYHKNGIGNGSWFHYANEEISALIDKANQELDIQERQKQIKEIQIKLLDDSAPLMNLVAPTTYSSYHKRVGGYDPLRRGAQGFLFSEYIKS